jgi:hypothetical protein
VLVLLDAKAGSVLGLCFDVVVVMSWGEWPGMLHSGSLGGSILRVYAHSRGRRQLCRRDATLAGIRVEHDGPGYRRTSSTWSSPRISSTAHTCRVGEMITSRRPKPVNRRWMRISAPAPVESMKVMPPTSR